MPTPQAPTGCSTGPTSCKPSQKMMGNVHVQESLSHLSEGASQDPGASPRHPVDVIKGNEPKSGTEELDTLVGQGLAAT